MKMFAILISHTLILRSGDNIEILPTECEGQAKARNIVSLKVSNFKGKEVVGPKFSR